MSAEAKRVPSIGKDDKNFRSHYYEKVGFRGVDERKTLDVLLQEDPFNIDKFCNFGQKCTIPYNDRINVWKIILGKNASGFSMFENNFECCVTLQELCQDTTRIRRVTGSGS